MSFAGRKVLNATLLQCYNATNCIMSNMFTDFNTPQHPIFGSLAKMSYLCTRKAGRKRIDAVANANRRSSPCDWSQCAMRREA